MAFKSPSFTSDVYKGLIELAVLEAAEVAGDSSAQEKLLTGSGADLCAQPPTPLAHCASHANHASHTYHGPNARWGEAVWQAAVPERRSDVERASLDVYQKPRFQGFD